VWSTLVATVVLLLFGEIIPKMLAVGDPGAAALRISRWLLVLTWILTPITATFLWLTHGIVRLFGGTVHHGPYVTEDDIKTLVNVGVEQNVLEEGERELIHSIIEFGDTVVREVMSPRTDLVAVDVSASPRAVLDLVITEGYSKIPAYENSIDNVVGVVHDRELLTILAKGALASTTIRELMRPVALVPENKRVSDLLREMQRGKFSIAVVVDEWGGTAGIVTMEDLLEEIVGEIRDERDEGEEEPIHHVGASEWIVTAGSNIQDVNDALGIHLPDDEFETIGGFTVGLFGRMPTVGEEIDADEVRLRIERARGRRILAVRVKRLVAPEDEVAVLETHHASEH
jgi:CBS domain containing-hemolysin-like protein